MVIPRAWIRKGEWDISAEQMMFTFAESGHPVFRSTWKQLVGKNIHGNICLGLVMKELSVFSAQRSTSFQILYCVLER